MKRLSLHLFFILLWIMLLRGLLVAQTIPRVEHSQSMHQYIVREAAALLQREDPAMYMRIRDHVGTQDAGTQPWEVRSILAGAWREDCEDIVYGHGGPDPALQPPMSINTPGKCLSVVYDEFRDEITGSPDVRGGLVTISHFWDTNGSNKHIFKGDIRVEADGALSCLSTSDQHVTIEANVNAWDKVQKLFRPMGEAILDRWWMEREEMYDGNLNLVCILPVRSSSLQVVRWKYTTLVDLLNTGQCAVQLPGETQWRQVVLTSDQRQRYVWQILGRICHLLADMSVPAHTHRDMHMGNLTVVRDVYKLDLKISTVRITVEDEDSYETWIGSPINAFWTADRIRAGLIDLTNVQDPLYHLMHSVRDLAASYASDDCDGTGVDRGEPRYALQIPLRHNLPYQQMPIAKRAMLCTIRDNTLPYVIRATATLLRWFASQLQMDATFEVRNVGEVGYQDFFIRHRLTDPFPSFGTVSGTVFLKDVGDILSLRSHTDPHSVTQAKFRLWTDAQHGTTTQHQFDDYVAENQGMISAEYRHSEVHASPSLADRDEFGNILHAVFPTFRNPWRIHAHQTTDWGIVQPDVFEPYIPQASHVSNGGVFLDAYDKDNPQFGYYSIRASHHLDAAALTHKTLPLDIGDFTFIDWESWAADLLKDPRDRQDPPDPAYPAPAEYETRIVDFRIPQATVNAHYKAHRSAANAVPPTRINSQRKVARDDEAVHHAVYESSGRIWYTRSTDGGASWSGEMLVSDFAGQSARPSIAAMGATVWIAYVEHGEIVLRVLAGKQWAQIYSAPVGMTQDATPALAVLNEHEGCKARGPVICLVWEDFEVLKFALLNELSVLVDNQVLVHGYRHPTSVDQPRYPSVAASTMPVNSRSSDHGFHIAWIENGSILYCRLGIDRYTLPLTISGWRAGGTAATETVHARNGSVGAMYPARHAPSIAVTELGTVHVAFDVVSSWSPWPILGVSQGANSTFVIRERPFLSLHGPTWQTTATIISTRNPAPGLCSPTIGAKPAYGIKGVKTASLRVAYNDRPGLLRVARIDGKIGIWPHADGIDPAMTVWSSENDGLLDVFSDDALAPYDWRLLSSANALFKEGEGTLLCQRQILLNDGESHAALGISDPRLSGDVGDERSLVWDPAHDSLVIGVNTTIEDKMRTAVFTPASGDHLRLDLECYGRGMEKSGAEVLLQLRDAATHEQLRIVSLPVQGFASAAVVSTRDIDLSALAGNALYLTASVHVAGEQWSVAIADRYALDESAVDQDVAKDVTAVMMSRPVLHQNHPNPFNPSTTISFTLREAAQLRLTVHNLLGVEVAVLADGMLAAGRHERQFDGERFPSGVYICRLECGGHTITRSMHLVK
ncbi:MAG: T9SS type A sorting domain-containing protein [Bacteroidetes bacterium]|nr:T9SS type A sorting domain-containing protein [Bacteroidota bacterium]